MAWRHTNIVEKAEVIRELNTLEPHYRFIPEDTFIDVLDLPFYPSAELLRVQKTGKPLWYVKLASEIVPLDGSGANINYLDVKAPLSPENKASAAYARFRKAFSRKTLPDDY